MREKIYRGYTIMLLIVIAITTFKAVLMLKTNNDIVIENVDETYEEYIKQDIALVGNTPVINQYYTMNKSSIGLAGIADIIDSYYNKQFSENTNNIELEIIEPEQLETTELETEEIIEEETTNTTWYTNEDLYELAKIIMCEAEGESQECKLFVGQVILNRMRDDEFPDTIHDVIFEKNGNTYQFSPTKPNGRWYKEEPNQACYDAAYAVLNATEPFTDALYFEACRGESWHSRNLTLLCQIDKTRFYSE